MSDSAVRALEREWKRTGVGLEGLMREYVREGVPLEGVVEKTGAEAFRFLGGFYQADNCGKLLETAGWRDYVDYVGEIGVRSRTFVHLAQIYLRTALNVNFTVNAVYFSRFDRYLSHKPRRFCDESDAVKAVFARALTDSVGALAAAASLPDSWRAHMRVAQALFLRGRFERAEDLVRLHEGDASYGAVGYLLLNQTLTGVPLEETKL